jgi:uroporphyrin-III C-methyltransferase
MSLLPDPSHMTALQREGSISLVGAGPGAADLLTGRALARIAAADVVFYDRLVSADVLALIPPSARAVNVGKEVGQCAWPQDRIDRLIVDSALQGLRVVRLKSGDPSVFGRAGEEIAAARAAGIKIEVVPGVTAASAAAASILDPLTERGRFDRLVLATGTTLAGKAPENLAPSLVPGTRLALYMAVHHADLLQAGLAAGGLNAALRVTVVSQTGTPFERVLRCALGDLGQEVRAQGIRNPAIIFVDIPLAQTVSDSAGAVALA